jgi:hypothetical protein
MLRYLDIFVGQPDFIRINANELWNGFWRHCHTLSGEQRLYQPVRIHFHYC